MRFTALQDFFSPELDSHYVNGLSYTVRDADRLLAWLVPEWAKDGKVRLGADNAKISGHGKVI